jgi:hypothetical protein
MSWAKFNATPEGLAAKRKGGRSTPRATSVEQGRRTARMLFRCSACGMETGVLALGRHQSATGHVGKFRLA